MPIQPGDTASRTMAVTPEVVEAYARITGDRNPLHFDEDFVRHTCLSRAASKPGVRVD